MTLRTGRFSAGHCDRIFRKGKTICGQMLQNERAGEVVQV